MPEYAVLDGQGNVLHHIVVSGDDYMDEHYPGAWRYADPPAPQSPPPITKLEFLSLLTDEEYAGILTAAKTVPAVEAWVKKFELAEDIRLDDPRMAAGVRGLEVAGLLAAGRAAEILS